MCIARYLVSLAPQAVSLICFAGRVLHPMQDFSVILPDLFPSFLRDFQSVQDSSNGLRYFCIASISLDPLLLLQKVL